MKNLPDKMIPDRDNNVYYDTEKKMFYIIRWTDGGNSDIPERFYINAPITPIAAKTKKKSSNPKDKIYYGVTRVEVIDQNGRVYVNWDKHNEVTSSLQDDGRTLKIFIKSK